MGSFSDMRTAPEEVIWGLKIMGVVDRTSISSIMTLTSGYTVVRGPLAQGRVTRRRPSPVARPLARFRDDISLRGHLPACLIAKGSCIMRVAADHKA